jgi:hypothetical protein
MRALTSGKRVQGGHQIDLTTIGRGPIYTHPIIANTPWRLDLTLVLELEPPPAAHRGAARQAARTTAWLSTGRGSVRRPLRLLVLLRLLRLLLHRLRSRGTCVWRRHGLEWGWVSHPCLHGVLRYVGT